MVTQRFRHNNHESTPFFLHSIASFHVYAALLSALTLRWNNAVRERRQVALLNAALNIWDAASQWLYWGSRVWTSMQQAPVDVGLPAVVALVALVGWWADKPRAANKLN